MFLLCCLTARIGSSGLAYSSHRFLRRHRTCRTWRQNTFLPILNKISFSLLGSDLLLSGFLIFEHLIGTVYFQKLFMRILKPQKSMRSRLFNKNETFIGKSSTSASFLSGCSFKASFLNAFRISRLSAFWEKNSKNLFQRSLQIWFSRSRFAFSCLSVVGIKCVRGCWTIEHVADRKYMLWDLPAMPHRYILRENETFQRLNSSFGRL